MARYFEYGDEAVAYLKAKDAKLGRAIDAVGHVCREMEEGDLFSAVVHHIVGQQISTAAQKTVWTRMQQALGIVTPETINAASVEKLQACGITFKKAGYIKHFAKAVSTGAFDLAAVEQMSDADAIKALSALPGIGAWTAEMLLLFCLGRPDVLSFGDLAIHRGMRMVYHHRNVTRAMFERYRRRYSPYGSVASLYLWAISHMDVPGYDHDYAPTSKTRAKRTRRSTPPALEPVPAPSQATEKGKPMQILFIEYPKCSTCKKAKAWLDARDVDYIDRHIVEDNPTAEELRIWWQASGLPLRRFFNTSGMLYRELNVKAQLDAGMTDDEALALLASNGMLVKRPLVVQGEGADMRVLVGFKEAAWEEALA